LDVIWIDIAPGETSVRLERSFDGATGSELAELPPNTRYYADRFSTNQCSTFLFYRLRTERDDVFSPYTAIHSNAVSPCAPSASWLELVNSGERVRVHWRDNASRLSSAELLPTPLHPRNKFGQPLGTTHTRPTDGVCAQLS